MADEDEQQEEQQEQPKEEAKEPGKASEAQAAMEAKLNELSQINEQLRGQVGVVTQQAGEARQYVGALLSKINEVAQRRPPEAMRETFDEDPEGAVNRMFNERVGPIVQEYLTNTARLHRERAAEKLGDNWNKYSGEIDNFMATMPLDVQAKPGAWEAAHRYIVAGHLDEEFESREKRKRERTSAAEGASARERRGAPREMEPAEREVMKAFGLDEKTWEEYRSDEIERVPPARKSRMERLREASRE